MSTAHLQRGREAYQRKAWKAAHDALAAAHEAGGLDVADLWRLGMASFLIGEEEDFVQALQDGHQTCLDRGDPVRAARFAFWIGMHLVNRNEVALGTGWLGRAARLVESADRECAEQGYLRITTGHRLLLSGEYRECERVAAECAAVAQRFGEGDLLALAVHLQGRAVIRDGRVAEGLALLDEAMVAVTAGELSPLVAGLIQCSVIGACREVFALRRVHEWTVALTEWCEAQPDMVPYAGECRLYRAEIMQLRGTWADALDEAHRAAEYFTRGSQPGALGMALYREGEIHRLRGELDAAEEAYRAASLEGQEPQPGLALLRLAQGATTDAASSIRRVMAETKDRFRRVRLLPAFIEIMLAVDDMETARAAFAELTEAAATCAADVLDTLVAHARGAIELAAGNPGEALAPLRRACREWRGLEAPRDAARARVLLGVACRAVGDRDGAALEIEAARLELERLGAVLDLRWLDTVTGRPEGQSAHGLTPREREVLAELATGRTNRAIARRLSISEKTVARHIANIFGKLGVTSRAAATAFAYEHGLVQRPT